MKWFYGRTFFILVICLFFFIVSATAQKQKNEKDVEEKIEKIENVSRPEPPETEPPSQNNPPTRNEPSPPSNPPPRNEPPTSGPGGGHNRGGDSGNRGNRDKKKKKRKKRKRNRNDDSGYYGNSPNIPITQPTFPISYETLLIRAFGLNDVIMPIVKDYLDPDKNNYLPFYETPLKGKYEPLYYSYLFEFNWPGQFKGDNWLFYYEPDLENIFINFPILNDITYDRVILLPVGKTIKKANRRFGYKGNENRPVLVEDISRYRLKEIFYFNVKKVPRGRYVLKLINRKGNTLKHQITID